MQINFVGLMLWVEAPVRLDLPPKETLDHTALVRKNLVAFVLVYSEVARSLSHGRF